MPYALNIPVAILSYTSNTYSDSVWRLPLHSQSGPVIRSTSVSAAVNILDSKAILRMDIRCRDIHINRYVKHKNIHRYAYRDDMGSL